ncbi:MAG TPA: hypothetical protein G4O15_02975 [Dehalococcoidia bacterium]|nr:hypothetical protein [Dehalococcoidia bacterium]
MKALVYGQKHMDETLSAMLKNEGIEIQELVDDFCTATYLGVEEKYDLAIVDSESNNVNTACRYIREHWDLPLVLVVDSMQADWKKLKPIEADGYIHYGNKDGEFSARTRALLRRLAGKKYFQRGNE